MEAADLTGTLSGERPFSVFASTDAAFAKLPAGSLETLLRPESKSMMQDSVTYRVVSGWPSGAYWRRIAAGRGGMALASVARGTLNVHMVSGTAAS